MSYDEARSYLEGLGIDAMKSMRPSTERIEAICDLMNHPEREAPAIHITGTNGKTSTARLATSLLVAGGMRVGTYTSPHLQTMRERISLNGEPIDKDAFGDVFDHIKPYIEIVQQQVGSDLTYFEVLTAMFFLWAADAPVDAMVVEVGLGGLWDATNVVPGRVACITNVGLDHTGLLGMERETIAVEKAGIIKHDSMVVTGERTPSVLAVIEEHAARAEASLSVLGKDFDVIDNRVALGGRYISVETSERSYEGLFVPLHGRHQGVNALIALEATNRFLHESLSDEVALQGFAQASAPGRLETLPQGSPDDPVVVMDVAHNPDGVSALVSALIETFAFKRATFVVGILGDKDYLGMLTELARVPCRLILTQPRNVRSVPVQELVDSAQQIGIEARVSDEVADAIKSAIEEAQPNDLVVITGSHYVVGEARDYLFGPAEK
ncbi:MAG: dihydrofolate synthase / folylpolyglutamate synthase [Actinomycetota bacterium]|nr:dihydrofolate synthase / folylpolyglutamate synthase [Actinomycetota bacterium]